jgi:hypothetical protein
MWAKFRPLADGAEIAARLLWKQGLSTLFPQQMAIFVDNS